MIKPGQGANFPKTQYIIHQAKTKYFQLKLTYWIELATERLRQLTTGKRAERTKRDLRCSICRSAIGQDVFLICARRRHRRLIFLLNLPTV